ncbi:MAG TPA: nuclear transport factor 2 family protein [Thermomicrobiales bacterium]|nr:nuclear transport factor 2 family protein [Thermomicrobiales bacterium]
MTAETNGQAAARFWEAMNTNDWHAAAQLLHDDYILEWPQSGERVRGRENFVAVNAHYPAAGPWRFTVQRLVASDQGAVTDVLVTAPAVTTRAVSFFELRDGRIRRMVEYWPDPFEAAAWRARWVERMEQGAGG